MVDRQWLAGSSIRAGRWAGIGLVVGMAAAGIAPQARASGPDEAVLDASALAVLEQRAAEAKPQEQCYLYTQLLHSLTEAAGRAMAAGDEQRVGATMLQMDEVISKIQSSSGRSVKRLKNAEELMEHTQRRLADMARAASSDEHEAVQATLQHLDKLHTKVLALVFSN